MRVTINGQPLRQNDGSVQFQWTNIRFSDTVADEWSTDVTFANDEWNIRLLGAYGLLDRQRLFSKRVKCGVSIGSEEWDGYLHVTSIKEDTITATVYIDSIPFEIMGKDLKEYFPADTPNTIYRWDRYTQFDHTIAGTPIGMFPYDYTKDRYNSNIHAQCHPSIEVRQIISEIQNAEDITLPATFNTLYQLSSKKVVCPDNKIQCLMGGYRGEAMIDMPFIGGQHITNDVKCSWSYADFKWNDYWTDWNASLTTWDLLENAKTTKLTMNRHAHAHIRIWAASSASQARMVMSKNGNSAGPYLHNYLFQVTESNHLSYNMSQCLHYDLELDLEDGDYLTFFIGQASGSIAGKAMTGWMAVIEWSDYEIDKENDYDVDLEYYPAPFGFPYGYRDATNMVPAIRYNPNGKGDGAFGVLDYSMCYMGAWSSAVGDMSVREWLNSLAWVHDRKFLLEHRALSFISNSAKQDITANMTEFGTAYDKLGRTNIFTYKEDEYPTEFYIDNEFLSDEVKIHESCFTTFPKEGGLNQYEYEMTYSEPKTGDPWITDVKVKFNDCGAVLMTALFDGNHYYMSRAPEIAGMDMPALDTAEYVKADTLDEGLRLIDYAYINGHKFLVADGTVDTDTGITTLTLVKWPNELPCYPAHISFVGSEVHMHSASVAYVISDITMAGTYSAELYTGTLPGVEVLSVHNITYTTAVARVSAEDGALGTLVGTYPAYYGQNTLGINGLQPETTYYLKIKAENECGETEQWFAFTTLAHELPQINVIDIFNITSDSAVARVEVTES